MSLVHRLRTALAQPPVLPPLEGDLDEGGVGGMFLRL